MEKLKVKYHFKLTLPNATCSHKLPLLMNAKNKQQS